eukprot:TRINITY_DN12585_c0_g1_i3.p1 TRINITY_DN12585_c0_g1~~TRINITY_DN12585_c0_g1_i3.p1  ORF type:complete len:447 (-),score=102.25 TRINITY_DN12585_c0_g1_i3:54-1394(-)
MTLHWLTTALLVAVASADHYGSGMSKSTTSASRPIDNFNWLAKYLPVQCQDSSTVCNTSFTCGSSGRGALCTNEECKWESLSFGLHLVNMSARPYGTTDNFEVENHFTAKLSRAMRRGQYDSFMDQSTVLYAGSIDGYLEAFGRDQVDHSLLVWQDDKGQTWYSVIVQVDQSQLVLELVTGKKPTESGRAVTDSLIRLPSSVFAANNVSGVSAGLLIALGVSKTTTNLPAMRDFYLNELHAAKNHSYSSPDGSVLLDCYQLPGANALVRVIQRPPSASHGSFSVASLEEVKNEAHRMAHVDQFCGVDKYYDNHLALDQSLWVLDSFKSNFDKSNRTYHIFGDCKASSAPGPGTNIYVAEPSGDTLQLDGQWDNCPKGGSGDALMDACGQGSCSKHRASTECAAALSVQCSGLGLRNTSCTDCGYTKWAALEASVCTNADVVNYCVK